MCVYIRVCMCVYVCLCVYLCMYVYVCICVWERKSVGGGRERKRERILGIFSTEQPWADWKRDGWVSICSHYKPLGTSFLWKYTIITSSPSNFKPKYYNNVEKVFEEIKTFFGQNLFRSLPYSLWVLCPISPASSCCCDTYCEGLGGLVLWIPGLYGTPLPFWLLWLIGTHLPPGFNALVDIVRERAAGNEAAGPLGHMQVAVFQHDLALADNHQRCPAKLHPFKDVVLCNLDSGTRTKPDHGYRMKRKRDGVISCVWDPIFGISRNWVTR